MLKGIIERSCIEGQKTYHADLETAARSYIKEHEEDFADPGVTVTKTGSTSAALASSSEESPTLLSQFLSPLPLSLLLLTLLLLVTNLFTLNAMRVQARAAHSARLGHPAEVANAVQGVLDGFQKVHRERGGGPGREEEVESLVRVVEGLEVGLREVRGRLEGLR